MELFFYGLFATLLFVAFVCQMGSVFVIYQLRKVEGSILDRYRSKVDKIPALIEILRKYTTKGEAFRELTELHRFAIISKSDRITHILELNSHITDRCSFLMRLALSMRGTAKDGNFITAREGITVLEGQLKELMIEHVRLTRLVNSIYKARDYSIFGALLPGRARPIISG